MHATLFALTAGAAMAFAQPAPDPKAAGIGHAMMHAMGGHDAWIHARFLRFDFVVGANGHEVLSRSHLWDKKTGRYRLEDKTATGAPGVVLFNTVTRQGTAYAGGKKLEGEAAANALKASYNVFRNDSFWLTMPWLWFEPGVHLKYLGRKNLAGKPFDVVELTFDKDMGPKPGDRYEAYVSPTTHLMEHWDYSLQTGEKGSWDWEYTATAGLELASNHTSTAKHATIGMGKVQVLDKVDDTYFTDPKHGLVKGGL